MPLSTLAPPVVLLLLLACPSTLLAADPPRAPRIDSVMMLDRQPHANDSSVIWYDDFDDPSRQEQYGEKQNSLTGEMHFGAVGSSLPMHYRKGERGSGGRKLFFGDSPTYLAKTIRNEESFDDVYWRIYVKHPPNWQGGGPAKLSRATSLVPPGWRQAMIAHVWSSGEALTLDPATGVQGNRVVTTRYNDFPNLNWLGNRPASQFRLHGVDGIGWWVCVEARAKLNTPGKQDGINQLWIDGRLAAERRGLDWRGSFAERGINAVFLEAYWNQGSPVDQSRWIDNFVVSTEPIGPVLCARTPEMIKSPYQGDGVQQAWQVELAADHDGDVVVWRSQNLRAPQRIAVNGQQGQFLGPLAGQNQLAADTIYYSRVRQQSNHGQWSSWSPWHQPFRTAK